MKAQIIFFLCTFLFTFNLCCQQTMDNLYEFIINDLYQEYIVSNSEKQNRKLFIDAPICEKDTTCEGYKVDFRKYQNIVLGLPNYVDNNVILCGISFPQIKGNCITIVAGKFALYFDEDLNTNVMENSGGTEYFFRYSSKYKKYIFLKKKIFGI